MVMLVIFIQDSLEGFEVRWLKKSEISELEKRKIIDALKANSEKLFGIMNCVEDETLKDNPEEVRLPLLEFNGKKVYVVVEYGTEAWHLILETDTDCIGEIAKEEKHFMSLLDRDEVDIETIE